MSARPILVMAGGTGGHVYPALAVARALQKESQEVVWLGTQRGLESRVVPESGIDIEWISIKGLRRKGALALIIAPLQLTWALLQALAVILRRRPAAVLGMGGFVSGRHAAPVSAARALSFHSARGEIAWRGGVLLPSGLETFRRTPWCPPPRLHSLAPRRSYAQSTR